VFSQLRLLIEQEVTNMMFKKLAIVGVAALGLSGFQLANAEDPPPPAVETDMTCGEGTCDVTATNTATDATYTAGDDSFVVNTFVFSVSANVALRAEENAVAIVVGTASNKGRTPYAGSSNGGSVTVCGVPTTGSEIPAVPTLSLDNSGGCGI
jgi:hypothetical protein